jgi:hypothetical protein
MNIHFRNNAFVFAGSKLYSIDTNLILFISYLQIKEIL